MVALAGGKAFEGKRKQTVAAKEKADQQVSCVALFVRNCHVDDERQLCHAHWLAWNHSGWVVVTLPAALALSPPLGEAHQSE